MALSMMNSEECRQFFKIFLPHHTDTQMRIPPAFLKLFKVSLPLKAILMTSSGKSWEVNMKKVDDDVYLQDGWEKFVKDNSLEFGDFLIFYHNGGSNFFVSISGKNGCLKEIDLEEDSKSEKQPIHVQVKEPTGTAEQKTVLGEEISKLSFEVRVQQRYMTRGYLPMPQVFYDGVKEYRGMAKLQHQDRTWDVKVDKYGERIRFNEGWSKFSAENCLIVGDVCCFKMIDIKPEFYLMDVAFCREY
uniref:B3 domain-containing transcription factor VRN1-like n=1 Tax=Erigeron canadensis TaxID=72917 RepID=UPI001CB9072E|nr:B3 domain-containing transcription factor VRN1-like [Erigeron canadensis]